MLLIAAVMALGGLLFARRVAETMSRRVTRMDHTQGVGAHALDWGIAWLALKTF